MDTNISGHIEITQGVCGGKPRIAGHRVRVQDIAIWHERLAMSADEIVSEYPQLALADVYAALTYYHDHRAEIESSIKDGEALAEFLRFETPSKLLEKLKDSGSDADPLSS